MGKKTAERLLVEMRDKLNDWLVGGGDQPAMSGAAATAPVADLAADAEGALISLGYKPQEASRMVAAVNDDDVADSEELIRRAEGSDDPEETHMNFAPRDPIKLRGRETSIDIRTV